MKKYGFIIVYLLLSAVLFAASMGITVTNLILNIILAGVLFKFEFINLYQFRILSFITLLGVNAAAVYLAMQDLYTTVNFAKIFNISIDLPDNMVYGIIILGGLLMLFVNNLIVKTLENKQA